MPEWLIVLITLDCMMIKIIRLGTNIISPAAAAIPDPAIVAEAPVTMALKKYDNVRMDSSVINKLEDSTDPQAVWNEIIATVASAGLTSGMTIFLTI